MTSRATRLALVALGLVLLSPARTAFPAGTSAGAVVAFRTRHGDAWSLQLDAATGRPRRLAGGAISWDGCLAGPDEEAVAACLADRARSFLDEAAALLDLDPATLRSATPGIIRAAGGTLHVLHFDVVPHGIPVVGARVTLAVSHGSLTYVHVVGTEPVVAPHEPVVMADDAITTALEAAGLSGRRHEIRRDAQLAFLPEGGRHRLAWRVTLADAFAPRRLRIDVDAATGTTLAVADETVSQCPPPVATPLRRAKGAARVERADDAERIELLPFVAIGGTASAADGLFPAPALPYEGVLQGPSTTVQCVGCTNPESPVAPANVDGDVDFGSGGADQVGNGASTPADRAATVHVDAARRLASRWLDLPFLSAPVAIRTNFPSECNAFYDGTALTFLRSSARCSNTGEIRDIIQHEWGHALDHADGIEPPGLAIDAATGEGVADVVAVLRSRDACIGESFYKDPLDFASPGCSGIRDLDENVRGHSLGDPATMTVGNVATKCPPSAFYRGPLGREGHCEGQVFGQAAWHLVQELKRTLGDEEAWQVAERILLGSRPLLACYAPSSLQSIGTSAYDALLAADDDGDGLANGTPHAAAIHAALAHHGLEESPVAPPSTPPCALPDPVVASGALADPSGLPAIRISWSDAGALRNHVLRADDDDDAFLPVASPFGLGAGTCVDRGVLPGRTYRYRVVAEGAPGCLSPGAVASIAVAGPSLRIASFAVDDTAGGNGDGLLAPGETADVLIALANDGAVPATGARVTLASSEPAVTVTFAGPVDAGRIGASVTVPVPVPFRIQVAPDAPRLVALTAVAECAEGCLRADRVVPLAQPWLDLAGQVVSDPSGDADGKWEPGEIALLAVALHNDGLLPAEEVQATLSFRGPPPAGVTLLQPTATWPPVAVDATEVSLPPAFRLAADPALGPRTKALLRLDTTIGGRPHRSFELSLTVGGFLPAEVKYQTHGGGFSPLVLQLTDDDGDGRITACDTPDIYASGTAFSGDTGAAIWTFADPRCPPGGFHAPAGGDIDGDGTNEVVLTDGDGHVCAVTSGGQLLWRSNEPRINSGVYQDVSVWDLDGDGTVEIVAGGLVVRGADGSTIFNVLAGSRTPVADLDLDGRWEVIAGSDAYEPDGSLAGTRIAGISEGSAVVNLDADPFPEFVAIGTVDVRARDHDGALLWQTAMPSTVDCPPCAGDFDGDGRAEVGISTAMRFLVLDDDGRVLWSAPVEDLTGNNAGCACFDFEGDGVLEIIHKDATRLRIFDSRDGEVLYSRAVESGTQREIPVVADVDGDGSADIVCSETAVRGNRGGVVVFENPAWAPARPVWNQEAYSVSHVADDGRILANPAPRWLGANDFRTQVSGCPCGQSLDVAATATSGCAGNAACFEILSPQPLATWAWDFGDGSPASTEVRPCHEYPGPGTWAVRLAATDAAGCPAEWTSVVTLGPPLAVAVAAPPPCQPPPSCFSVAITGGTAPIEVAWDFGDGSPLASGDVTCHDFATDGAYTVTAFARDARGCLAEDSRTLVVGGGPPVLPEVSAASSADPLLVRKVAGGQVLVTCENVSLPQGLHEGSLDVLRSGAYTHGRAACGGRGSFVVRPAFRNGYFLVAVEKPCPALPREGSYGASSLGVERPNATELGRLSCP